VRPAPFEYFAPRTVEEALDLLARHGDEAKLLAGGQSLVPMMNMRLVRPAVVVDLNRVAALGAMREDGGRLHLGALVRQHALERDGRVAAAAPLLAEAAPLIGHLQTRARGTIGGSLAHADPAAELPVVAVAHAGEVVAHGPHGERRIPLAEFFLGYLETALGPDEVLVAVELERPPEGSGVGFHEEAQRVDDFALACAAAVVAPDGHARVVVGGVGDRPLRFEGPADELPAAVEAAVEPEEDAFVSAAFRRRLAGVCARRALARAEEDAGA
jgi:carbon-monoxide dehydrogenase medium subunit